MKGKEDAMKSYDPKTAARVWDRVQNAPVPVGDAQLILNVIAEETVDAATYLQLSKRLPPPQAAVVKQLAQQEQAHVTCLKGIYTMITGEKPKYPPPQITNDPPDIVLRRCYGREMRALAQYEACQNDPQYGHVFRTLARQEKEHCHRLLEILGALQK